MTKILLVTIGSVGVIALSSQQTVFAHGFGERYDLPVPLWIYTAGAGAVVAASFALIAVFSKNESKPLGYPRFDLLSTRPGRLLAHPAFLLLLKAASVGLFLLLVVAGFFGTENPNANIAPALTWVIFWVAVPYCSAFAGNIWALLNPWKVLFGWSDHTWRALAGYPLTLNRPYPHRLGSWPAVILFVAFAWVEAVDTNSADPNRLASLAVVYSVVTFTGMFWYGRDAWLRHGEVFSIVFGFMANFAPTEIRVGEAVDDYEAYAAAPRAQRQWNLRFWGTGLIARQPSPAGQTPLLILMLGTVTFDGLRETSTWVSGVTALQDVLGLFGHNIFGVGGSLGLLLVPLAFGAAFWSACALAGWIGQSEASPGELASLFVKSLIPIAVAYHVAHFLSFLLIQGQLVIPLASDPLGRGWNFLGTADYQVNIGVINARVAWFLGVTAIVVGHVAAVATAHVWAVHHFTDRRLALRSQYPMLVLMVGYTMVSLWIIAQPITEA